MKESNLYKGLWVGYQQPHSMAIEYGRVKTLDPGSGFVFVVYNVGGEWDNYQNYTAARTAISDLIAIIPPAKYYLLKRIKQQLGRAVDCTTAIEGRSQAAITRALVLMATEVRMYEDIEKLIIS